MSHYLVTGGAGFIGSNIVYRLVQSGHRVRVLDDFSTGRRENIENILEDIELFEGNICDRKLVTEAMKDVDYCLHQAAIPSVPRSIDQPWESNRANVEGTINMFLAARDCSVRRVAFASSSAVYGNTSVMPLCESFPVDPVSPYGVTKAADELYAGVFSELFHMDIVGLRYFNVFGIRQDPNSQYAAVVPRFISQMLANQRPTVHGDGRQSRDFTYVDNVVSANLKACQVQGDISGIYNVACGNSTSVLQLVDILNEILATRIEPEFQPARQGDIRDSCADIGKARTSLGYEPLVSVKEGLAKTVAWFKERCH